jgi:transposase-like protein
MSKEEKADRKQRRSFTEEFRCSVVDHLLTSGNAIEQVAQEFGLTAGMLRVWKARYGALARPTDGTGPPSRQELARQVRRHRSAMADSVFSHQLPFKFSRGRGSRA